MNRVRFAPSPTGYLHVGGARTAIFNWLFARHTGGAFVLRIEDTDADRSTYESEVSLLADLRWLGLDWDEGPEVGGTGGPYRQSERTKLYEDYAARFVDEGMAYPCFCTDDELKKKREDALREGRAPQYDGTCRFLSAERVAALRASGVSETVRFRVPGTGSAMFHDLVRGGVTLDYHMVGDFVIMRSNGLPTYNYAAAVDDRCMRITHVIRGEEHLPNTLRQILIHQAMAGLDGDSSADLPVFAHVPLILAEDRSKLSKRHGSASVGELRERGFLPEAVVNYLLLLGWSHPEGREVLSRQQMVDAFDVARVGRAPAVFDPNKLVWMNGQHIRSMDDGTFRTRALDYLPGWVRDLYDASARASIVDILRDSIETLTDIPDRCAVFADPVLPDDEATGVLDTDSARNVLEVFAKLAADSVDADWTPAGFKTLVKKAGKQAERKGRDLYFPLRAAITGSVHGPDLGQIAAIKGRERVLHLVNAAR